MSHLLCSLDPEHIASSKHALHIKWLVRLLPRLERRCECNELMFAWFLDTVVLNFQQKFISSACFFPLPEEVLWWNKRNNTLRYSADFIVLYGK